MPSNCAIGSVSLTQVIDPNAVLLTPFTRAIGFLIYHRVFFTSLYLVGPCPWLHDATYVRCAFSLHILRFPPARRRRRKRVERLTATPGPASTGTCRVALASCIEKQSPQAQHHQICALTTHFVITTPRLSRVCEPAIEDAIQTAAEQQSRIVLVWGTILRICIHR